MKSETDKLVLLGRGEGKERGEQPGQSIELVSKYLITNFICEREVGSIETLII